MLSAIRATRVKLGRRPLVREVHELMLSRASAEPTVALVVLWLRYLELPLAVLDSKQRGPTGDWQLYRTAFTAGQLLFAVRCAGAGPSRSHGDFAGSPNRTVMSPPRLSTRGRVAYTRTRRCDT